MSGNYDERDVTFDIIEEIGVISTQGTGWTKELNIVRWNGGVAKYDIRDWDPSHDRMSRGITLHEEEMRRILDMMKHRRSKFRNKSAASESSSPAGASENSSPESGSDLSEVDNTAPETDFCAADTNDSAESED